MKDEKKYKYVVGIDFGHGETSAAYCCLEDGNAKVVDIRIQNNEETIPSAIFIPNDCRSEKIGGAAFEQENLKRGTIYVGIKQKPQMPPKDVEKSTAWCHFMNAVITAIKNNKEVPFHADEFCVYIAQPSCWGIEARNRYYKYTTEKEYAGLPLKSQDAIVNESRAAFVSAQRSESVKKVGRDIYKGTVVIDMGSSTVDLTYLSDNNFPNKTESGYYIKDEGYYCGASVIEEAVLNHEAESNENLRVLLQDEKLRYPILYKIRKLKEAYFSELKEKQLTVYFEEYNPGIKGKAIFIINDETIDKYTKDYKQGFEKALVDYLRSLENKLGAKPEIHYIILTGGASRMQFAKKIVGEKWHINEANIYNADNPSLTVSRGIAEVARMDILTRGKKEEIEYLIQSKCSDTNIQIDVAPNFIKNVISLIKERCEQIVKNDKAPSKCLMSNILKTCDDILSNNETIQEQLCKTIDESDVIKSKVEQIVRYYSDIGMNENFLLQTIDISDISEFIKKSNGISSIFQNMQEEIGKELTRLQESFWSRIFRRFSHLFESKEKKRKRELQEQSDNRKKGENVIFPYKLKEELSRQLDRYFDKLPDRLSFVLNRQYFLNNLKKCSEQYLYGLLNNIDQVRKEITENE